MPRIVISMVCLVALLRVPSPGVCGQRITPENLDKIHAQPTLDREATGIYLAPDGLRIAFVRRNKPVELFGPDLFGQFHKVGSDKTVDFAFSSSPEVVAYSMEDEGVVVPRGWFVRTFVAARSQGKRLPAYALVVLTE